VTYRRDDTNLHLWDDTIGTVRSTDKWPNGPHHVVMNAFAAQTGALLTAPKLRLLPAKSAVPNERSSGTARREGSERPALHLVERVTHDARPVLVAGADREGRAAVLADLTDTMAPGTAFAEAQAFWEVLVHAPSSSMVVLSGELDELPAESLMQMLAHRHPGLPVVSIDAPLSSGGARLARG
jgi:hypothetical protein